MTKLLDTPTEHWERRTEGSSSAPERYQHTHLALTLSIMEHSTTAKPDADPDTYGIIGTWPVPAIGDDVFARFTPEEPITSPTEVRDWVIALMLEIDNQYTPDDPYYVITAMENLGADVGSLPEEKHQLIDEEICPICGAQLSQFHGNTLFETKRNHRDYMDDQSHDNWQIST